MEVTWSKLFELVERMWALTPIEIAGCLDVNRSVISKLKSGDQKSFRKKPNEIYDALFDPALPHMHGADEKSLIKDIIEEIDNLGLTNVIESVKYDDYKTFILELIKLIKRKQPVEKNAIKNKGTNISNESTTPQSTSPLEEMRQIFIKAFDDHCISRFTSDTFRGIRTDLLFKSDRFIETIELDILHHYRDYHNEKIYKQISKFTYSLGKYKDAFIKSTRRWDPDVYLPLLRDTDDLGESVKYYRQQIHELYSKILFDWK